jgi:hypothetical protein
MERKQQLEKSLAATVENGNFCNERNPIKIFFRNCYLWTCQLFLVGSIGWSLDNAAKA